MLPLTLARGGSSQRSPRDQRRWRPFRSLEQTHRRLAGGLRCERLEPRYVLSAAFDLVGLTALRSDPLYADIDGQLPSGDKIGIAILDTGVASWHPDLQANFIVGYDAVNGGEVFFDPRQNDSTGHGTHVAGTAASTNPAYGVATGAGIVDVRVLPGPNDAVQTDPILVGLQWVIQNYAEYGIRVVNMSLGSFENHSGPTATFHPITRSIKTLEELGVTVVTAAGNSYGLFADETGAAFPANVSTLSVGNVWSHSEIFENPIVGGREFDPVWTFEQLVLPDMFAASSQRSLSSNHIVAPGSAILSTSSRGGSQKENGTSMASPLVAGAVALMQDAAQTFGGRWLAPNEIHRILIDTAVPIFDYQHGFNWRSPPLSTVRFELPETNAWYPRIDVYRSIKAVRDLFPPTDVDAVIDGAAYVPPLTGTSVFSFDGSIGFDGTTAIGPNDVDLYKLTLELPGIVGIDTVPGPQGQPFDAYLRLFDAAGREIARANDGGTPYPRLESLRLDAGTYYVGVSSFDNSRYSITDGRGRAGGQSTGSYRITIGLSNNDPNGTIPGSLSFTSLVEMQSIFGNATSPYYFWPGDIGTDPSPDRQGRVTVGGYDVDMFEYIAPDDGALNVQVITSSHGDGSPNPFWFDSLIRVFDEDGNELAASGFGDASIDSHVTVALQMGQRVFVGISDVAGDFYDPWSPFRSPNDTYGGLYYGVTWFDNGDADGDAFRATTMPVGIRRYAQIGRDSTTDVGADGTRDVDMYFMPQQASGLLEVTITGSGDFVPQVRIYAGDALTGDVWLWAASEKADVTHQVYVNPDLVYMVSVTGQGNSGYQWYDASLGSGGTTGNYQITAIYRGEDAWWDLSNDWLGSPATQSLPLDVWRTETLGRDRNLHRGANDVDLFRFTAAEDNTIDFLTSVGGDSFVDTVLRVFDADGQELGFNDNQSDTARSSRVRIDVVQGRTYYVGVSGWNDEDLRPYDPVNYLSYVEGSVGDYSIVAAEVLTPREMDGNVWLQENRYGRLYAMREKIKSAGKQLVGDIQGRWRAIAADTDGAGNFLLLQGRGETRYRWPAATSWEMLDMFATLKVIGVPELPTGARGDVGDSSSSTDTSSSGTSSSGGSASNTGDSSGSSGSGEGDAGDGGFVAFSLATGPAAARGNDAHLMAWAALAYEQGMAAPWSPTGDSWGRGRRWP